MNVKYSISNVYGAGKVMLREKVIESHALILKESLPINNLVAFTS